MAIRRPRRFATAKRTHCVSEPTSAAFLAENALRGASSVRLSLKKALEDELLYESDEGVKECHCLCSATELSTDDKRQTTNESGLIGAKPDSTDP